MIDGQPSHSLIVDFQNKDRFEFILYYFLFEFEVVGFWGTGGATSLIVHSPYNCYFYTVIHSHCIKGSNGTAGTKAVGPRHPPRRCGCHQPEQ